MKLDLDSSSVINLSSLCRVCLTQSVNMMLLDHDVYCKYDQKELTIKEILQRFLKSEVSQNDMYPQQMCALCVSLLKIAYEFRMQYDDSEKTLSELLRDDAEETTNSIKEPSVISDEPSSSVDIIVNGNSYSLDELVIVEDEDNDNAHDYSGFLSKLGSEISATYVNEKSHSFQAAESQNEVIYINTTPQVPSNNVTNVKLNKKPKVTNKPRKHGQICKIHNIIASDEDSFTVVYNVDNIPEQCVVVPEPCSEISATVVNEENHLFPAAQSQNEVVINTKTQIPLDNAINVTENNKAKVINKLEKGEETRKIDNIIASDENSITVVYNVDHMRVQLNHVKKKTDHEQLIHVEKEADIPELFKCNICNCDKIFTKTNFTQHLKRMHSGKQYICKHCKHVSYTLSSWKNHEQTHLGRQFKCHICDKAYFSRTHLNAHMNKHSHKKKYLCSWCGKVYFDCSGLRYHLRMHTGEKKYVCFHCGKKYTSSCGLTGHLRTHTGSKPYHCRFCDRLFALLTQRKIHEMYHTGERPYCCKYCNKGFTKLSHMKTHLLSHPGSYGCNLCSKTFIELYLLKRHMRLVHKVGDESKQTEECLQKSYESEDHCQQEIATFEQEIITDGFQQEIITDALEQEIVTDGFQQEIKEESSSSHSERTA